MKRGVYEIFIMLTFLVVMLVALFIWLQVTGSITLLKAASGEERFSTSLAKEAFGNVTSCNQQQVLAEDGIDGCIGNVTFVKAIKVEQGAFDECPEKTWGVDAFELASRDLTTNAYPYWVAVAQNDSARVCLARMTILV